MISNDGNLDFDRVLQSVKIFCNDINDKKFDNNQLQYLRSYDYFVDYFKDVENFEKKHVVIGAGFTYSWMPRILSWKQLDNDKALLRAVDTLDKAKKLSSIKDIITSNFNAIKLRQVVADSHIGTSKLLHFVNPDVFPIYDVHICHYLYSKNNKALKSSDINRKFRYDCYISSMSKLLEHDEFDSKLYKPVKESLVDNGFSLVSKIRATEMAIFHHQRKVLTKGKL